MPCSEPLCYWSMVLNVQEGFLWELGCRSVLKDELGFRSVKKSKNNIPDSTSNLSLVLEAEVTTQEWTAQWLSVWSLEPDFAASSPGATTY